MPDAGDGPNFWTTLPGILTAVAGLVTAFAGLLIALNQVGVVGSSDATQDESSSAASSPSDTGQDDELPTPFESAEMYEMVGDLFYPADCQQVASEDDAPLAWNLEPQPGELVKCEMPTGTYAAVVMCSDAGNLADIRDAYLENAIAGTMMDILEPPAGWDEPSDGVQKSFEHVGTQESRVYWDSPSRSCAAELQSASASVEDTVAFWVNGQP